MGTFITLAGVNPPATYPRVDLPDAILPDTGALYLYEFGHPSSEFPAGVPTNGQIVRNLARTQAAAVVGASEGATDASLNITAVTAGSAILERTSKGGLHSIHSQTAAASGGFHLPVPAPILDYLAAHPDHDIYQSIWGRITRPGDSTQGWAGIAFNATVSGTTLLFSVAQDGNNYPTGSTRIGSRRVPAGAWRPSANAAIAAGPLFANTAVNQNTGALDATRSGKAMSVRTGNPFPAQATPAAQLSAIIYRSYLEDLTLSGRSYSDVDALDWAAFQRHVMTAGGRYYNDTYTNPSVLA